MGCAESQTHTSESEDGTVEVEKRLDNLRTKLRPIEIPSFETETSKHDVLRHFYDWVIETEEYEGFFKRQRVPDDVDSGVLCVTGPAGAGKTTLMRATVQGLLEEAKATANTDGFNLACFFCGSRDKTNSGATLAIKSLIWQILRSQPSLMQHMEKKFRTTGRDTFDDPNDFYAMSIVLYDILRDVNFDGSRKLRLTYIIVDAIEELGVDDDVPGSLNTNSAVSEVAQSSKFSEPFQSQVTAELSAMNPRNLLWVAMACRRIKLHGLPWNATTILCRLPKDVNKLYHEAYETIDKLDYPEDQARCRDILFTTAIAYRTLSISEVENLLGLPANVDVEIMCYWLKNVEQALLLLKAHQSIKSSEDLDLKYSLPFLPSTSELRQKLLWKAPRWLEVAPAIEASAAAGGDDGMVRLWDAETFKIQHAFEMGRCVYQIWDWPTGAHIASLGPTGRVHSSPDGRKLVAAKARDLATFVIASDSNGKEWTESTLELTDGGFYDVKVVRLSPDGALIAYTKGVTVFLWDIQSRKHRSLPGRHRSDITGLDFSHNSKYLASCSNGDGAVHVWDIDDETGEPLSSNDNTVIVWDISNTLQDVDTGQHEVEPSPTKHDSFVTFIAFSPRGDLFASALSSGTISLWDSNDGHLLGALDGHCSDITWLDFSYNGQILVSSSIDKTVCVWDTSSRAHCESVVVAAFSPKGTYLASGGDDPDIMIWKLKLGDGDKQEPEIVIDHSSDGGILGLTFTKDEKRIVSCDSDGVIEIWKLETGTCEQTLRHNQPHKIFRTIQLDEGPTDILITEIGAWPITIKRPSSSASASNLDTTPEPTRSRLNRRAPPDWCPYGISNDRRWITWNNRNLIYLPAHYRPSNHEWVACRVHDRMVVIGSDSGKVLFFKFPANESPSFEGEDVS
ncbi:hypothetical protein ONZ43_g128 [Nemania bipapillata]|uniref:Uncharacterized protein n=1 Tax=Nemania bipapillata TaxID=110536 RepID=A0ACC2J9F4_9PEZI|nr:hypothetical protein ONZ43_g128 [Nemania bipapillata]